MEDSSTSAASPNDSSPVLSPAYDPLVLDLVAPPSPESPVAFELRRSTWVSTPPYLIDYHYSCALATPSMYLTSIVRPILTLFGNKL